MNFAIKLNGKEVVKYLPHTGICIAVVFIILIFIYLIIALTNKINIKKKTKEVKQEATPVANSPKQIKLEDITDEDMMVAVLIATIDYQQETQKDVRLVRVNRIG